MRTTYLTRNQRIQRAAAVLALAGLGSLTLGVGPAAAETTPVQTSSFDLGDLDDAGTGEFDQFDPSLGTLESVTITAEVSMSFDVCVTNLSTADTAIVVPAGEATGTAVLTFAGDVVADVAGSMPVPQLTLQPSDGGDDCQAFVDSDRATEPASADSVLTSQSGVVDTFSTTITDPEILALYTGTDTVPFDFVPGSESTINQPSEWTIAFLADGSGEASIQYEYAENETPATPEPPEPTESSGTTPPGDSAPDGELPNTGGPGAWWLAVGAALVALGGGALAVRRYRGGTA
jgi:LPXTG-motif cell wall-anchored protein